MSAEKGRSIFFTRKKNMKSISVVLPVFKVEKYIERCLDSLIGQTFSDFELIIVDDCGGDNSIEICKRKLQDSGITYVMVFNDSNRGLSESRNIGIRLSNSHFVICIDPDDWMDRRMLETLYLAAIKTDADIVTCGASKFWEESGRFSQIPVLRKGCFTSPEYLRIFFSGEVHAYIWMRLCKRKLYNDVRFPEQVIFEDFLTLPYLIQKANKVVELDDTLYFYVQRQHSSSITGTRPTNLPGFFRCLKKLQCDFQNETLGGWKIKTFVYKHIYGITYHCLSMSSPYTEIKLDLSSAKSAIDLNELFTIRRSLEPKVFLFLICLKVSRRLTYHSFRAQKLVKQQRNVPSVLFKAGSTLRREEKL